MPTSSDKKFPGVVSAWLLDYDGCVEQFFFFLATKRQGRAARFLKLLLQPIIAAYEAHNDLHPAVPFRVVFMNGSTRQTEFINLLNHLNDRPPEYRGCVFQNLVALYDRIKSALHQHYEGDVPFEFELDRFTTPDAFPHLRDLSEFSPWQYWQEEAGNTIVAQSKNYAQKQKEIGAAIQLQDKVQTCVDDNKVTIHVLFANYLALRFPSAKQVVANAIDDRVANDLNRGPGDADGLYADLYQFLREHPELIPNRVVLQAFHFHQGAFTREGFVSRRGDLLLKALRLEGFSGQTLLAAEFIKFVQQVFPVANNAFHDCNFLKLPTTAIASCAASAGVGSISEADAEVPNSMLPKARLISYFSRQCFPLDVLQFAPGVVDQFAKQQGFNYKGAIEIKRVQPPSNMFPVKRPSAKQSWLQQIMTGLGSLLWRNRGSVAAIAVLLLVLSGRLTGSMTSRFSLGRSTKP